MLYKYTLFQEKNALSAGGTPSVFTGIRAPSFRYDNHFNSHVKVQNECRSKMKNASHFEMTVIL